MLDGGSGKLAQSSATYCGVAIAWSSQKWQRFYLSPVDLNAMYDSGVLTDVPFLADLALLQSAVDSDLPYPV